MIASIAAHEEIERLKTIVEASKLINSSIEADSLFNSILVQLIEAADYVIDLGPEGGDAGGEIVATGSPEEIAAHPRSVTGRYLGMRCQALPL